MEARPALSSLCCVNPECKMFGQKGQDNLKVRKIYGPAQLRYLRCQACQEEFSERKGSALFNCKIGETKAVAVVEHLDAGCGVATTATLVGVCKDTVSRLLRVAGRQAHRAHDHLVQHLAPPALQLDEKWSWSGAKHAPSAAARGPRWDVNCLDPHSKLLITLVPGPRSAATMGQAVTDAASRLAPQAPLPGLFTDGEAAYEPALRRVFGRPYPAPGPLVTTRADGAPPRSGASRSSWSMPKCSSAARGVASSRSRCGPSGAKASCPRSWPNWVGSWPTPAPSNAST